MVNKDVTEPVIIVTIWANTPFETAKGMWETLNCLRSGFSSRLEKGYELPNAEALDDYWKDHHIISNREKEALIQVWVNTQRKGHGNTAS